MKDQTVMVPLVELPGWLQAAGWGLLSASGLLIGAVGGYYTQLRHTAIARVMTFAAGVLFAVVAVDLVINARGATSLYWTVMGLCVAQQSSVQLTGYFPAAGQSTENAAANA